MKLTCQTTDSKGPAAWQVSAVAHQNGCFVRHVLGRLHARMRFKCCATLCAWCSAPLHSAHGMGLVSS